MDSNVYNFGVTPSGFNHRILVVDDDDSICKVSQALLEAQGYGVRTAHDGFEALVELRRAPPDVIISDLNMPNMSGFELLSIVRKRFPHIPVIAISGEYAAIAPDGCIADFFFSKGDYSPAELFAKIAEFLKQAPLRPRFNKLDTAPVWLPRDKANYYVVTCTECLRSFAVEDDSQEEVHKTACFFCDTKLTFLTHPGGMNRKYSRSPVVK